MGAEWGIHEGRQETHTAFLAGKPEGKKPIGRPRRRWGWCETGWYGMVGGRTWIRLAQMDKCLALTTMVMSLRIVEMHGNSWQLWHCLLASHRYQRFTELVERLYCSILSAKKAVPVAAPSKAWACGRSLAEILSSNPARDMDICLVCVCVCVCCLLSGRGFCDELITRPEESYRLWCIVECGLETSRMSRTWPALGRSALRKNQQWRLNKNNFLNWRVSYSFGKWLNDL